MKKLIFSYFLLLAFVTPVWAATETVTFPVGKRPVAVAIDPTLNLSAVVNKKDQTVSIIDLATVPPSLRSTIPVGKKPNGVAIAINGTNLVAVTNEKDGTLTMINLITGGIKTVQIGPKPNGISLIPSKKLAIVPFFLKGRARLAFINLGTNTVFATLPLGKGIPVGVATNEAGSVAAVILENQVVLVDLSTRTIRASIGIKGKPTDIAIDKTRNHALVTMSDGRLLAVELSSGKILDDRFVGNHLMAIGINPVSNELILLDKGEKGEFIDSESESDESDDDAIRVDKRKTRLLRLNLGDKTIIEEILLEGKKPVDLAVNPRTTQLGVVDKKENTLTLLQLPHPIPILEAISPTNIDAGSPDMKLTLNGSRFVASSIIRVAGTDLPTRFISDKHLSATLPAALLTSSGEILIKVVTPAPGGGASVALPFIIRSTAPEIVSFTPTSGPPGTQVIVSGRGFVPGHTLARVDGVEAPITAISKTALTLIVPPGAITGSIFIKTPEGMGVSSTQFIVTASQDFALNALPTTLPMAQGSSAMAVVTLISTGQTPFTGAVSLGFATLPVGLTATLLPYSTLSAGGIRRLQVNATADAPVGKFLLTLTGDTMMNGQVVRRTTSLSVEVTAGGQTALSGNIYDGETERPIKGVMLMVGEHATTTDSGGHFLLTGLPSGQQTLMVDANVAVAGLPIYSISQEIISGVTTLIPPFWIHPPPPPTAFTPIANSTADQVITDPRFPGVEITLPQGATITGWDGILKTKIAIEQWPLDRLPIPPPPVNTRSIYHVSFGTPMGGLPSVIIPVTLPNDLGRAPGERLELWYYDAAPLPGAAGIWRMAGNGTVSEDGTRIVSDPGVGITRFCGTCGTVCFAGKGAPGGNGPTGGDPVDLSSGQLTFKKTDLVVPGNPPIIIQRVARSISASEQSAGLLGTLGAFGPSQALGYDYLLIPQGDLQIVLKEPDRFAVPFTKVGVGRFWNQSRVEYTGAELTWDNPASGLATLRFKDGRIWKFSNFSGKGALTEQIDLNGNRLTIQRDFNGNAIGIRSSSGQFVAITVSVNRPVLITTITDSIGRRIEYSYNSTFQLETVRDPNGGITRYTYDTSHQMTEITDARGILYLQNEYSIGQVIRQRLADGGEWRFSYPRPVGSSSGGGGGGGGGGGASVEGPISAGLIDVLAFDPNGHVMNHRFGSTGFLTNEEINALGERTKTDRNVAGQVLASTDPLMRVTRYTYDERGNATSTTDSTGQKTLFEYEPTFSRVTKITDAIGNITTFQYDDKGNLISSTDPLGKTTTLRYNEKGQPLTITDPLANTTAFEYDGAGNLTAMIDPLGNRTTRGYDAINRLVTMTEARGFTSRYDYDTLNRVSGITDSQGSRTRFSYDANGNLLTVTDAKGQTTTYTYDLMDRLASRADSLGRTERYEYDKNGNLMKFIDRKSQVSLFTYDALNRRIRASYADGGASGFVYDVVGRLSEVSDFVAGLSQFRYDALDRLAQELTARGFVNYTYDALGRRTTQSVNGGAPVAYTYDAVSRLTSVGQGNQGITLGYDAAGRRTSLTYPNGVNAVYSYDNASRLAAIVHTGAAGVVESLAYTYDPAGNRDGMNRLGPLAPLPPSVQMAYDAANEMIRFNNANLSYDANGNLTFDGEKTYLWDARNRLTGMAGSGVTADFAYDAMGRRISKTINGVATQYLYDGNDIVAELDSNNVVTANTLRGLSIDEPFMRTTVTGKEFYHTDALGSTIALTNSTGNITTRYAYDPFGNTTVTGTSTNPFQYTGRENDGTGLYYYRARYYSPKMQRFISEDPIGFRGGDVNLYAYVRNNPVRFRDPYGLITVIAGGGGSGVAGVGMEYSGGGYIDTSSGEAGFFGSEGRGEGFNVSGDIFGGLVWGELAGSTKNVNYSLPLGLNLTFFNDPKTMDMTGFTIGWGPGLPGASITESNTGTKCLLGCRK